MAHLSINAYIHKIHGVCPSSTFTFAFYIYIYMLHLHLYIYMYTYVYNFHPFPQDPLQRCSSSTSTHAMPQAYSCSTHKYCSNHDFNDVCYLMQFRFQLTYQPWNVSNLKSDSGSLIESLFSPVVVLEQQCQNVGFSYVKIENLSSAQEQVKQVFVANPV